MSEFPQTNQLMQAGVVDPTMIDPAAARSFENLRQQPLNVETVLEGVPLDEAPTLQVDRVPLASQIARDGSKFMAMPYAIQTAGQEYQVWVGAEASGHFKTDKVTITKAGYDISAPDDDPRSWRIDLDTKRGAVMHLPVNEENTASIGFAYDEEFGLKIIPPQSKDAEQNRVRILSRGELEPDNEKPKHPEEVAYLGSTALNSTLPPKQGTHVGNRQSSISKRPVVVHNAQATQPASGRRRWFNE